MKCQNCNRTITRKSKFCTHCGKEIILKKTVEPESKKPQMPIGLAVILVTAGVVLGFAIAKLTENINTPTQQNVVTNAMSSQATIDARVSQIASQFMCPCGSCEDVLNECTCEHPNGALEIKTFIAQQLQAGHKSPHITQMIKQRYSPKPSETAFLLEFEKQLNQ